MAEFTRDIPTLQRQASQAPQVAPPSQSLGGDIVNALGTGMQMYQQHKAREQLQEAKILQSAQERKLSQGVLGLRQLRQELSNQGVNQTTLLSKENNFLKNFSPEERIAIIQQTKEVTGKTLASFSSDLASTEAKKLSDRQALEEELAELSPYSSQPIDIGADDAVLQNQLLHAKANKAEAEKKKADAVLKGTQLTNQEKENTVLARNYLIDYGTKVGNVMVQQTYGMLDEIDFNNTTQVQDAAKLLGQRKQQFITTAVQDAAERGITITQAEAETQLSAQLVEFDNVQRLLSRKDIADMSSNQRKYLVNNTVLGLKSDPSPEAQKLSYFLTWSDVLENNPYLQQDIASQQMSALINGLAAKKFAPTPLEGRESSESKGMVEQGVNFFKGLFKNAVEGASDEEKELITNTIVEDLTSGPRGTDRLLQNGGLTAYVEGIATGKPEYVIDEKQKDDVLEGLMLKSEDFLRRAIPAVLTKQQLGSVKPSGRGIKQRKGPAVVTGTGEEMFDMLGDDLKLSVEGSGRYLTKEARKYNKWVDNVFVAMDKLGATEDEKEWLKNEIRRSFNISNNVSHEKTLEE